MSPPSSSLPCRPTQNDRRDDALAAVSRPEQGGLHVSKRSPFSGGDGQESPPMLYPSFSHLHLEQGLPFLQECQRLRGVDGQGFVHVVDGFPAPAPQSEPRAAPSTTRDVKHTKKNGDARSSPARI